jgi:uncharacterized protein YqfA (UPF0365 family)
VVIELFAQAAPNPAAVWIFIGVLIFMAMSFGYLLWLWNTIYGLWVRSFTSGADVRLVDLIGMNLRKTNAKLIVDCHIMSVQAKTPISMKDLEIAHMSGADVELVTRAFIESEKTEQGSSFEELVDASRSEKLAELLGMKK